MRRASLSAGLALIASAALWQLGLARRWTQRIPVGWRTASHYVGTATYPDPKTGRLPEGGELARYDRTQRVSSDAGRPRWVGAVGGTRGRGAGRDGIRSFGAGLERPRSARLSTSQPRLLPAGDENRAAARPLG